MFVGGGHQATTQVIVRGVRGATLSVSPSSATLTAIGATRQLTATVRDPTTASVPGVTVSWASDITNIVTVTASGLVTAVGGGTANIVATAVGGAADTVTITVVGPTAPRPVTDLVQRQSDGATAIALGGAAPQTAVVLGAAASDTNDTDSLRLEIELRPVSTAFSDVATHSTGRFGNPGSVTLRAEGLARDTAYHWQTRACDQGNLCGPWTAFGGNAESAATISRRAPSYSRRAASGDTPFHSAYTASLNFCQLEG